MSHHRSGFSQGRYAQGFPTLCLGIFLVALSPGRAAPNAPPDSGNLMVNGDFEAGTVTPAAWQTIDGLSTFWVEDPDPARGRILKIDTDILQKQGYEWWARIREGASPKDAPTKLPTVPPKYDTLAGLDGVWFWSDPIPVEKGKAYWFTVDVKGPEILTWLVGYTNGPDTRFGADAAAFMGYLRDRKNPEFVTARGHKGFIHNYVWKGQMKAGGSGEWTTYSRRAKPFRPTESTPAVRFMRVMLYAYWPPGIYCIDNVRVTAVPDPRPGAAETPELRTNNDP